MLFWPRFNTHAYEKYSGDLHGEFEKAYEGLESELYVHEFQKYACFHLFNLDVSGDVLAISNSAENPELFIADESLMKLASIARRSILSFITFYLNGETKLSDVQGYFPTALLNQEFGDAIRKKADLGLFLASLPNSASPVIPVVRADK